MNDEIYTQDGDYIKDVEINDLRNRYTLTKGSTQKMVNTLFAFEPTDTTPESLSFWKPCSVRPSDIFACRWVCRDHVRGEHQAYF